jgi:hypothetical protein
MTFVLAAFGGVLIGLSAAWMLWSMGRIAGISGIWSQVISGEATEHWPYLFVGGLVAGGLVAGMFFPERLWAAPVAPMWAVVIAGLIVGWGTRLGSGCTSGHGVCGLSRLSVRSLAATMTFMGTGALTVFVVRMLGGLS